MGENFTSLQAQVSAGQTQTAAIPASRLRLHRRIGFLFAMAILLAGSYVLWLCFNATPGRVGLEFPFDLVFYYFPMLQQAADRLRQGDLPLWNPYQCCGVPFLATAQVAVFYPPTWLVLLLPVGLAIQTLMFGQVFAAGVFACLFFRALGRSLFASTMGGLLFSFGCTLGQIYWPSEVSTIVWFPFLMWCVERFVQSGRPRWWALFTMGVTLQALAGFPQFMVYSFYLLVPYAAVRLIADRYAARRSEPTATGRSARWTRSAAVGKSSALLAGCALAAGLAAVQLVPTFELARNTARNGNLTPKAVHYLETERGKYFRLPDLLENMFDPAAKMITFDFPDGSGYLGMAAPLMIGLGLALGRRDYRVWFFLAAAVVSCTLAFGYNDYSGWLYRTYSKLPTGSMFRTPSRLLLLTYFSLIAIAVYGIDRLGDGLPELRGKLNLRIILAVLAVGFLSAANAVGSEDGVHLAAAFILLMVTAYLLGPHRLARGAIQVLFAGLVVFDLAHAIAPYGSVRDIPVEWGQRPHWSGVSPIDTGQLTDVVEHAGLNRIALPGLRPTKLISPPAPFYMVTEYEPLLPERWFWTNKTMGGEPGFVMCAIDPDKYGAFYDMAGVTRLFRTEVSDLARKRMGPRQWEIHSRVPGPAPVGVRTTLESRPTSLPRAYTTARFEVCSSSEALTRFVHADFDHQQCVLLEEQPGIAQGEGPLKPAEIASYRPERVVVRSGAAEPRLLVLTDTFFPGWKAFVDGVETRILRANYLFRAVVVPPGTHDVVFEYRPASFRTGLAVSGVALVLFVGAIGLAWRCGRRAPRR